jgi:hypothetical protein
MPVTEVMITDLPEEKGGGMPGEMPGGMGIVVPKIRTIV